MADKREGGAATAEKAKTGKSLKMVSIPTVEMSEAIETAAKSQGVSPNRWITNLIAREFNLTVPEPKRRTAPLLDVFVAQYPRNEGETDEAYDARFKEFKAAQIREANAKRAERTKSAVDLMAKLKEAQESGTLEELDIASLLAQLKS